MRRVIKCFVAAICATGMIFTGCTSSQDKDARYNADRAIIRLTDGTIVSGRVESVYHYSNGTVSVTIDGVDYEVHSMNCTLIDE